MNDNSHQSDENSFGDRHGLREAFAPVERILSIENVAETFGIGRLALRYCEFLGLIRRHRIGSARVYGWADCERIAFIVKCRGAGLRFSEIAALLRATEDESARVHETAQEYCQTLAQRLEARRETIDEALSELNHVHALLEDRLRGAEPRHRV